MREIPWYFDFISPFAYLQSRLLARFEGRARIVPVPVLFAGLLQHWKTVGPAEVAPKRVWTYRYCQWWADAHGLPFRMPPAHPFNPIRPLRLAVSAGGAAEIVHGIFRFIWAEGRDPVAEWPALCRALGVADADARVEEAAVKDRLRANTEAAIAAGVFGVPSLVIDGAVFWGVDGTDFALAALADPGLLGRGELARAARVPVGVERRR
jgi:2-hydroxychromene-2-carboxylate isomerase